MEDMNENSKEENDINHFLSDINEFISSKNKNDKAKLYEKLEVAKKKLIQSTIPENLARSAIINYIINYQKINFLSKKECAKKLADDFINYFPKKDVIEISLDSLSKKFKDDSLSLIISFGKKINKEKNHLEFFFKVLLLLQNINEIIEGINSQLDTKNDSIKEVLENLNFQNPYAVLLIRDLINELILKQSDIKVEDTLQNIKENIKMYYPFYCPDCLEICLVIYDKKVSLFCPKEKCYFIPETIDDLKNKFAFYQKCKICNKIIQLYENNYKCNACKNFYCNKCAKEHEKSDIKNVMLNLYELGYICEQHCELYSTSCNICQKNLCEICKESHWHKIDENNILSLDESLLKTNSSKKLDEKTTVKEYILKRLSLIYLYTRNFDLNNYTIKASIYFGEKFNKKNETDTNNFYFEQFFNDAFRKYYSKLIQNVSKGREIYFELLTSIKDNYVLLKPNIDHSFNDFVLSHLVQQVKRSENKTNYISNIKFAFISFDYNDRDIKLNNKVIALNNQCLKLRSDIHLLKIKIIALLKSNKLYTSYLMNIINRYLSNFLLRKTVEKYPSKFSPIHISLKNFYEIATNFTDVVLKNNKNNSILNNLINKLKLANNQNGLNELEKNNSFIESLRDENNIMFISPIKIKDETFSAEEMNYVLDTLFYFKNPGNIIAHINIEPKESIKLKNINKDIPDIALFLKNIETNDIFDSNNNKNNISNGINNNSNINEISNNKNEIKTNLNNENISNTNEINTNLSDNNFIKKIIDNIYKDKQDWLEIKESIIKGTTEIISSIKNQILNDFYDSSINEYLNINDFINCIFKNEFRNMFTTNSAFTRALSSIIDDMIKPENITIDFSAFNEIKDLIDITYDNIKSLDKLKKKLNKLNLELPDKIYRQTKIYIQNHIESLSREDPKTKLVSLKYIRIFDELTEKEISFPDFDEGEKNALILSLALPVIKKIQLNNLDIFLKEFKNSIENYYIIHNVKIITEKLLNDLETNIDIKMETNSKDEIKKFIASKSTSNSNNINFNYERIIDIIAKMFAGEKIQWTKLPLSDISLESLLFFNQNK